MDDLLEKLKVAGSLAEQERIAEAHLANLRSFSYPKLDQFREDIRKRKTSDLLSYLGQTEAMTQIFDDAPDDLSEQHAEAVQKRVLAAIIAVYDEIDRRIPIPTDTP